MSTFTSNLKLGATAFVVTDDTYKARIEALTVGQIRIVRTMPSARAFDDDSVYKEEAMCIETGVGSGSVYTFGKHIFATREDAEHAVLERDMRLAKNRAERDAYLAEQAAKKRDLDLITLRQLKEKYESAGA